MVYLTSSCGEVFLEPYEINHTLSDFKKLKERIEDHDIYHEGLTVFMESTANYHRSIKRFFSEETLYEVQVINPLHSAMHKRNLRKTKTDKQDCYNLANLFFTGRVKNHEEHDQYYLNLNAMAREYDFLIGNTTRFKNKFKGQVNMTFPEYENLFKGALIYSNTALSLIEKYPHADIISATRVDALANFMATLMVDMKIITKEKLI